MKRYRHNEQYEIISRTRCGNLFKKMLVKLPDLAKQISPQGFENSVYHARYFPDAERAYYDYRVSRAMSYKRARQYGTPFLVNDMISFPDFQKTFNPAPPDLQSEILNLFIEGIEDIFNRCSLVHDGRFTYKLGYGFQFKECMFKAVKAVFPEYATGEPWELFSVRTYDDFDPVDFRPVYCYIFSLLKKERLDYRYEIISSKIFNQLIGKIEAIALEIKIDQILKEDEVDCTIEDESEQSRLQLEADRELLEALMEVPPTVDAYFDVYGHWPDNYPPADD